jgi:uncharacterized coiled-coil protein SlyX
LASRADNPEGEGFDLDIARLNAVWAAAAEQQLANARQEIAKAQPYLDQLAEAQKGRLKAEQDAAAALERYTNELEANTQKLADAGVVYDIHKQTARATGVTPPPDADGPPTGTAGAPPNVPFEQTPEGIARRDWTQLTAAYDRLGEGGTLYAAQQQMIEGIIQGITGHTVAMDKIFATLKGFFDSQAEKNAAFERLVATIASQMQNSGNKAGTQF